MPFHALMNIEDVSSDGFLVGELVATYGTVEAEALMNLAIVAPPIGIAFEDHATDLALERFFSHVIDWNQ